MADLDNLDTPPKDNTGRIQRAVHEEVFEVNSALVSMLRRWWIIAVGAGGIVWYAAGYLGHKADAKELDELKSTVVVIGNRVTAVEQLAPAITRIESQLYQLALRAGAPIVTQSPASPLPSPPLR